LSIENLTLYKSVDLEELTKVIIVGDNYQLPPVQPVKPPKNLEKILESIFTYYVKHHGISNIQLRSNYRSHRDIVNFTSRLDLYEDINANKENSLTKITGDLTKIKQHWLKYVLDPDKVVSVIIHDRKFDIGVSSLEAEIVKNIVVSYYDMKSPKNENEEISFWSEKIGVVAPHNAQGRLIIRSIFHKMTNQKNRRTLLGNDDLMRFLRNSIYSVEKFQGSDRNLIISSIGLSDRDQLNAESEFIYNLNRFNVLTSRAKSKLILVISRKFLEFIPGDRKIMKQAAQVRKYAYDFCNKEKIISILNEKKKKEDLIFRYR
jgi:superfamily I DNA and/or RNA helicase